MTASATDAASAPGRLRRLLVFPLTRLLLALMSIAVAFIARDVVANGLLRLPPDAVAARGVVTVLVVWLTYALYVRAVERRPVRELELRYALGELGGGMALGAGLIAFVVFVLWLAGAYDVLGMNPSTALLVPLLATAATAFWEELVFRGVVFRIFEEGLGTWTALILSAASFGLLHLGNENASIFAAVTIAVVAGVLLAGVYILTRRLWAAIGAHYAVNLTQGPILGLPLSGRETTGLVQARLEGSDLLTGGAFGIEASVVTAMVGSMLALVVLARAHARGHFVGPLWSRRRADAEGGIL
jgi:uncharacterized protein